MKHQTALAFEDHFAIPTPLPTRDVMGLSLVDASTQRTIDWLLDGPVRTAFFLNAHCANVRARDPHYAAALNRADAILPDGIGVELAARMGGKGLTENLNGTDFTPALLREAARKGMSVYLFGGTPGTAEKAADNLVLQIPGLRVVGVRDGFEGAQDSEAAIADINASGADIVVVAMGVPMQEMWIDRHANDLSAKLIMGVGALLDFLAGNVQRAPAMVRKAKMEWAWRLAMEPRRMANRYLVGNFTFMARAARHTMQQVQTADVAKRAFDICAAGAGLAVLSPLLLIVALLIRVESRGPVLFRQTRVGRDGTAFTILKFRSMHVDAEERLAKLRETSDRAGVCFKSRTDPRVTRIGRILRRLSIDELPQIINVVKGDMSLVGPRPGLPSEVAAYPAHAHERLNARPGITGLWQVSGRADIGFDKMIDLDVAYVRSRSFLLDLLLLVMTARAVVSGRGAY